MVLQMARFRLFSLLSTTAYICIPHLYPFIDGHLGCFHISAIINNAAVNIGMHRSVILVEKTDEKTDDDKLRDGLVFFLGNSKKA